MAQPYVGEIRMFGGNFAPAGWAFCDGQLLAISDNDTLFTLIGTTYGGNGQTTFALPDLRGRLPIHQGNGVVLAERGGAEQVTLTVNQIPAHNHPLLGSNATANSSGPANQFVAKPDKSLYRAGTATAAFAAQSVSPVGGGQPHNNYQPYLCVSFIIALFGIFPSQN